MSDSQPADWPSEDLEWLGACPVCGNDRRTVVYTGLRDRLGAPGEWTLHRCAGCLSGYIDPRPTLGSVGRLYETYYTHEAPNGGRAAPSAAARLREALLLGHVNARYGYRMRPSVPVAGSIAVAVFPGARGMASRRVRSLPHPAGGGRLLDVGCANGEFLIRMRDLGWEVEGIDPDPRAVEIAQAAGLDVRLGVLEEATAPDERYDAITLSHVIEHLHDPPAVLRACLRALRPGGRIWIATPNMDAHGRREFGPSWAGLDPPRHLVLFTRVALERALAEAGFADRDRPPTTLEAAGWTYRASAAIALGEDPHRPPPLDRSTALRAVGADLATLVDRSGEEELCMTATKPPT